MKLFYQKDGENPVQIGEPKTYITGEKMIRQHISQIGDHCFCLDYFQDIEDHMCVSYGAQDRYFFFT